MFLRKKPRPVPAPPPGRPALESSVCTGETVIGFPDGRGKLLRAEAVRSQKDIDDFCRENGVPPEDVPRWRRGEG